MATPEGLIDAAEAYYDDVDAPDAGTTRRRLRLLHFLQHVYEYVHNYREWEYTFKEGSALNITGGSNSVALPADFLEFGRNGMLYDSGRRVKLREESRHIVERERQALGGASAASYYDIFAIWDGKVQVPYTASATVALTPYYRRKAETLADDDTVLLMPDRYANTVLLPALIYRTQMSKNDAREDWGSMFQQGLAKMCVLEQPRKTSPQRLPLHAKGVW